MATETDELVKVWQEYLRTADWQQLIKGITPKNTNCGPIYDIPNPINRPNESFAIADMRAIPFAAPHYHTGGESEIYFCLQGSGTVVLGGKTRPFKPGDVEVTPPETAHYTIPDKDLVLAVVNTPPFDSHNVIDLTDSNPAVDFDKAQFDQLTTGR